MVKFVVRVFGSGGNHDFACEAPELPVDSAALELVAQKDNKVLHVGVFSLSRKMDAMLGNEQVPLLTLSGRPSRYSDSATLIRGVELV